MKHLIVLLSIVALALAQIGDYSHVAGGSFNKAGYHPAKNMALYDASNGRYVDIQSANFNGVVNQIASVGNGVVAVGAFTQVNGQTAVGFAYHNGSQWCGFPHLSLLYYNKPNNKDVTNYQQFSNPGLSAVQSAYYPTTYISGAAGVSVGSAVAVYASNNYVYILGGTVAGKPRFNLIGEQLTSNPSIANGNPTGFDGLTRFIFANGNFTLDTSFNTYISQGGKFACSFPAPWACNGTEFNPSQNGGGQFVADTLPLPTPPLKFKVQNPTSSAPTLFVYLGGSSVFYWAPNMAAWLNPLAGGTFNTTSSTSAPAFVQVMNSPTQVTGAVINDADFDPANGLIFVAGIFNNTGSNAQTGVLNYFHVATLTVVTTGLTTGTGNINQLSWSPSNSVPSFNAISGLTNAGFFQGVNKITVTSSTNYLFTAFYQDPAQTNNNNNIRFNSYGNYRYFQVSGSSTTQLGASANSPGAARFQADAGQLLNIGGIPIVIGTDGQLYNNQYSQVDISNTRYIKQFSAAIGFQNNDWSDMFGGFVIGGGPYQIAQNVNGSNLWYIYSAGITGAYDIYSAGSVAVYNNNANVQKWLNLAPNRFTTRATNNLGGNGAIYATHWLSGALNANSDNIVVAGTFDTYGTQWLGSIATTRLNSANVATTGATNPTYSSLGGGLWIASNLQSINDQDTNVLNAGTVYDIEQNGAILYAAGSFSSNINFNCINNIAALNYQDGNGYFYGLGSGCNGAVADILFSGGKLYAVGNFDNCGSTFGTRGVAYWDTSVNQWFAMGTGFPGSTVAPSITPGDSRGFAIESYQGSIYVGGKFAASPGGLRSGSSGLFKWNGNYWSNVLARCEAFCDVTEFEAPVQASNGASYDPVGRVVPAPVTSLRSYQGYLYAIGSGSLYGFNGNLINKFGTATGGCLKQGCLSRNTTGNQLLAGGFNEAGPALGGNTNVQAFSLSNGNNWVSLQYGGFDASPNFLASASVFSVSVILSLALIMFAIFF